MRKITLGVEEDAPRRALQEQRRPCCGEAKPQKLPWHGLVFVESAAGSPGLHNLHLKHIAASLEARATPTTANQVLEAALAERHEDLTFATAQDIQCGVGCV